MNKLTLTSVTNFLVDQGEFVDESITDLLRSVLDDKDVSKDTLKRFFSKNFPDLYVCCFY